MLLGLAVPALVLARPVTPGKGLEPCAPDSDYGHPVALKVVSNKPFVHVRIGNSRPLEFLLDTGSAYASIDNKLIDGLRFRRSAASNYSDSIGPNEVTETTLEPRPCERMAGATLSGGLITALDLSSFSAAEGIAVEGLLGGDFLSRYVIAIDYGRHTVQVFNRSFEYHGTGIALPITIEDGQIFTRAAFKKPSGEDVEGKLCVDTGARMALLLTHPFADVNGLMQRQMVVPKATVGVGFGGETQAMIFQLPQLALGSLRLREITTLVSLQENLFTTAFPDVVGILGGDFLRHYKLLLDYPHRRIILEGTWDSHRATGFDKSGMFLLAQGDHLRSIKVASTIPRGPADVAGIMADDILESINGVPTVELGLDKTRQLFLIEGRRYALKVRRNGDVRSIALATADVLTTPAAVQFPP